MNILTKEQNFLGLEEKFSSFESSEIVVLPAPFEKTVTYGKGTANGPAELLKASHYVEFYDEELNRELCFEKGIATLTPLEFDDSIENSLNLIYLEVKKLLRAGKFVASVGGEHSISAPIIKAFNERFENISILQIDAHSDLRQTYEGSKYSHACVMARVLEFNSNIVQVGIRAQAKEERTLIAERGIKTFFMRDIRAKYDNGKWIKEVVESLSKNVYLTFDVDGLDPSVIGATGTPEPGGLLWDETLDLIKLTGKEKNIVGFDLVELAPNEHYFNSNFVAAKLFYKILNYVFQ